MAVRITCITKSNGYHENPYTAIEYLGWINEQTNDQGKATRLEMYDYLKKGNQAYVKDRFNNVAYLMTAESSRGTKYVKTVADETRTDNLLSLSEC